MQHTLATWKAESTTQGIGQMVPQRKAVGPPTGNNAPVRRGAGGWWTRRLPGRNCPALLSGSFEDWALGPDPYSAKEWGGAAGKALALAELGLSLLLSLNWRQQLPPCGDWKCGARAPCLPQVTVWHETRLRASLKVDSCRLEPNSAGARVSFCIPELQTSPSCG